MIEANCLIFPKPTRFDPQIIERNLIYIPRNLDQKHYSTCQVMDDLTSINSSTARTQSQFFSNNVSKFNSMLTLRKKKQLPNGYIPCVYLKSTSLQNKIIVYFHSNAEDIVSAFHFVQAINAGLGRSILMMEYPGYSLYRQYTENPKRSANFLDKIFVKQKQEIKLTKLETKAEDIEQDAIKVIEYLKQNVGYNLKDITVMGRSIGSGPAMYLASIYSVGSLILLSPFLSLCDVVKDLYGNLCSMLLKQRFNNKQRAKLIKCPTLIIHGMEDTIIPHKHSINLHKQFKTFSTLKLVEKMKHNAFHLHRDFLIHVKQFMKNVEICQQ